MYKCIWCGNKFEEPDFYMEDRGEYWGMPCEEKIYCSPCCKDDYEEMIEEDEEYEDECDGD